MQAYTKRPSYFPSLISWGMLVSLSLCPFIRDQSTVALFLTVLRATLALTRKHTLTSSLSFKVGSYFPPLLASRLSCSTISDHTQQKIVLEIFSMGFWWWYGALCLYQNGRINRNGDSHVSSQGITRTGLSIKILSTRGDLNPANL